MEMMGEGSHVLIEREIEKSAIQDGTADVVERDPSDEAMLAFNDEASAKPIVQALFDCDKQTLRCVADELIPE
jgi:hypothetical protein